MNEWTHRDVVVNGVRLHCVEAGTGPPRRSSARAVPRPAGTMRTRTALLPETGSADSPKLLRISGGLAAFVAQLNEGASRQPAARANPLGALPAAAFAVEGSAAFGTGRENVTGLFHHRCFLSWHVLNRLESPAGKGPSEPE